jgi:tetrahydromethanopterin S-methyltransferase subunit A
MADPERIDASYDTHKEWSADPKGYFLIKIFPESNELGVRYQSYKHEPIKDIYGKDAESIVQTLVREGLISRLQHAAYLGHELHKAEVALRLGLEFVQDKPLEFKTQ